MQPTVGRMVHYFAYGTPKGEFKAGEARAAVVTEVNEDGTVGLAVLNPTGMFFNRNVKQGQEGGCWDWMPFQKDQQARAGYAEAEKAQAGNTGSSQASS